MFKTGALALNMFQACLGIQPSQLGCCPRAAKLTSELSTHGDWYVISHGTAEQLASLQLDALSITGLSAGYTTAA